jgi:hypothetical protein
VGVRLDEAGDDELAGEIDNGGASRRCSARTDRLDRLAFDDDRRVADWGRAGPVDDRGAAKHQAVALLCLYGPAAFGSAQARKAGHYVR